MTDPNPTLAMCVPAYNAESFLARLLESAAKQTIPFDEIWVYDDASRDGTSEVARKWGAKVVRGEINAGCSVGKNVLAHRCTCSWIHFHDADDALEPNFVEMAKPWIIRSDGPDVVFFSYRSLDHLTGAPIGTREFSSAALRADPLRYCLTEQINPFCGIYRKKPFIGVGGWDEDRAVLQSEDQAGHLRMSAGGMHFDADPAYTVINYIRQGSMTTGNMAGAQRSTYEVMKKAAGMTSPNYHGIIAERLWSVAGQSAAYLDWDNADRSVALAHSLLQQVPTSAGAAWFRKVAAHWPRLALRIREGAIRLARPGSRADPVYHPKAGHSKAC